MNAGPAWPVERHRGSAGEFHRRSVPDPPERALWWFEVTGPAVVLGSTQSTEVVDAEAAAGSGVEVVRRRSGGGAVWLEPGVLTWVDVILPADDEHWVDDIGQAAVWLGSAWAAALEALGVERVEVHTAPMARTPHSDLVCFAGRAPGEVTIAGQKAVGISQRRARSGARFQCAVLHHWDPRPLVDLLAVGPRRRLSLAAELADVAVGTGPVDPVALVHAVAAALDATGRAAR
jgi:lipoate-protein ligase A